MIDLILVLFNIATALVAISSGICAATSAPKDDSIFAKAYPVIELLAINIGKAKE